MKHLYNRLSFQQKKAYWAWLFLAVPILFFAAVRFYPTINAAMISFTDWNLLTEGKWVGLANYERMFTDKVFWKVFANTFLYLIVGLPVSLTLAFVVAYYLDQVRFMHGFIRSLYFIPYLTTAVAMAWVWRWGYQPAPMGVINQILSSIGMPQQPFLRSPNQALYAVLAPAIWAGLGFQVIIFMAGLRAIPETYYEAARIDGIGKLATLWEITLPLLRPTLVFIVVLTSIGLLRIFDQVYNMTVDGQGGPLNATRPLVLNIYNTAFKDFDMGYATAQTMVLFLVLLIITLIQLRLMRSK
ncbi:carbohydrate ABC transporter permease [Szabonella alba]|uniref:Sugar ABC transporter permease n=1 Tax=Szabonella alba TaxID=2804194 RepID=A0A8K0VAN9_9RHOB|nr:sugar ABC transporter permease [Szabonella alba]MBL4916723.1 sugar ABC transporter permease [Szabonella alba]